MLFLIAIALTVVTFFTIYFNLKYHFNYFKKHKVNHVEPSLLLGNLEDLVLMRKDPVEWMNSLYYSKNARHQPYIGIFVFHKPGLLIREPELIKQIVVKDFQHFTNRHTNIVGKHDSLAGNNLFFSGSVNWKILRTKLSPVFTSENIKQMFMLFDEVGNNLHAVLSDLTADKRFASVEIKEICNSFTTDVISSVGFGVETNSLSDPKCFVRRKLESLFTSTFRKTIYNTMVFFAPSFAKYILPELFSKDSKDFLKSLIKATIKNREDDGIVRNDLIDILISLKKEAIEFTDNEVISQTALFIGGGLGSTSSLMSFALYELAKNQEVQTKLRAEIKNTFSENEGMITYDVVTTGMPYLNNVIQEVLRLYPLTPFIDREITLFEGETGYSFEPFGSFKAPNKTPVYIPVASIHRNRKFFPNPNGFNPERFNSENINQINFCSYLPFGVGQRNCIGELFGLLLVKVGLINFLKGHYLRLNEKSCKKIEFKSSIVALQAKGGIYLDIVKKE